MEYKDGVFGAEKIVIVSYWLLMVRKGVVRISDLHQITSIAQA